MKPSTFARAARRRRAATPDPVYREPRPALLDLSHRAPRLTRARPADHAAILRLLAGIFGGPSPAEFQAQQDEPLYEPTDRLLVKSGDEVVAHLRQSKRVLHFGPAELPAVAIMDLATAPEFRGNGFATAMLAAAERVAAREGALLAVTRTRAVTLFARQGWAVCGRHTFSTAGARQILAQLGGEAEASDGGSNGALPLPLYRPQTAELHVRPMRRIELPAVMALYDHCSRDGFGWPVRSEDYWDWLLHRGAYDAAYVATNGPDRLDLTKPTPDIAGYAFLKEGRIVELLAAASSQAAASRKLLARVCRDAMERNVSEIRLDAPANDPLHELLICAGGQWLAREQYAGEAWMVKLLDPLKLLSLLGPLMLARAREAGLATPLQLGLCFADNSASEGEADSLRLTMTSRSVKWEAAAPGRSQLVLSRRDLAALLLGHWPFADAIALGRVRASTQLAAQIGRALFPALPFWLPPLDDLLA